MEDWPQHVNIFCQIFGGFPLKCTVRPDGKKQFCSSVTSQLWSVTLVSLQFFASMLWACKWYEMYTMNSVFFHEHKVFEGMILVRTIAITTMLLVLFFSYNRKQMRFVRIHYDLDRFDRNLRLTTKSGHATIEMVATCIVSTALPSISHYSLRLYGFYGLGSRRALGSLQSHHSEYSCKIPEFNLQDRGSRGREQFQKFDALPNPSLW
ncbi:hypothetical protein J6590_080195 [Homalodisca vitripennis]|nr:hypothetical protein J6590_080195 [Homalodisca vitripennis]